MQTDSSDPHVVFDDMWEAAYRLIGLHARHVTIRGLDDPAMQATTAIGELVESVPAHDTEAQRAVTADLDARYIQLRAGYGDPGPTVALRLHPTSQFTSRGPLD